MTFAVNKPELQGRALQHRPRLNFPIFRPNALSIQQLLSVKMLDDVMKESNKASVVSEQFDRTE